MKRLKCYAAKLSVILVFMSVWTVLHAVFSPSEEIFPSLPSLVLEVFRLIADGTLILSAIHSLYRLTLGFYSAVVVGVSIGLLLGRSQSLRCFISFAIEFARPISPIAWMPLAVYWFGVGEVSSSFLIYLAAVFPIITAVTSASRSVPREWLHTAENLGYTRSQVLTEIVFPAILPATLTACRVALGVAWVVLVAAEMTTTAPGIGYFILESRDALRLDHVLIGMWLTGVFGLGLNHLAQMLEKSPALEWARHER